MECVIGYIKILCAGYRTLKILCVGTASRGARLKLRNYVLTMMLSTNRYKKHSRVFSYLLTWKIRRVHELTVKPAKIMP